MATTKAGYRQISLYEDVLTELKDIQDPHPESRWPNVSTIVLSMTTIIFGLQSLYLSLLPGNACLEKATATFEEGYPTEWAPAKAAIEISKVSFKSALRYNQTSKTYYREHDPDEPQYVGAPSPTIDHAWEELLGGQYLILTKEEGLQLDDPVLVHGIYLAEIDVMHSLHCLNVIRKSLNREYYAVHDKHKVPKPVQSVHEEHCLEQLRQTIQCAGDLTPVPIRPYGEGKESSYIGTSQVHTCRNWDTFRKWYTKRGDEYGTVR